jgi:hypothetical protein
MKHKKLWTQIEKFIETDERCQNIDWYDRGEDRFWIRHKNGSTETIFFHTRTNILYYRESIIKFMQSEEKVKLELIHGDAWLSNRSRADLKLVG